jgi:hypothetical protein
MFGGCGILDRCFDLAVYHDATKGLVVLEYASEGHGWYRAQLRRPVYLSAHAPRARGRALAGLPRTGRCIRCAGLAATLTSRPPQHAGPGEGEHVLAFGQRLRLAPEAVHTDAETRVRLR